MARAARSLQWQLAASYAAMAAVLCTAMGLVIMEALTQISARFMMQRRAESGNGGGRHRSTAAGHTAGPNLRIVLDQASQNVQARVCAYASGGSQLACSDNRACPALSMRMTAWYRTPMCGSRPRRSRRPAAYLPSQSSIFGFVQLSDPLTYRSSIERSTQSAIFHISIVATIIAAASGLLLGRGLTAPLPRVERRGASTRRR